MFVSGLAVDIKALGRLVNEGHQVRMLAPSYSQAGRRLAHEIEGLAAASKRQIGLVPRVYMYPDPCQRRVFRCPFLLCCFFSRQAVLRRDLEEQQKQQQQQRMTGAKRVCVKKKVEAKYQCAGTPDDGFWGGDGGVISYFFSLPTA